MFEAPQDNECSFCGGEIGRNDVVGIASGTNVNGVEVVHALACENCASSLGDESDRFPRSLWRSLTRAYRTFRPTPPAIEAGDWAWEVYDEQEEAPGRVLRAVGTLPGSSEGEAAPPLEDGDAGGPEMCKCCPGKSASARVMHARRLAYLRGLQPELHTEEGRMDDWLWDGEKWTTPRID